MREHRKIRDMVNCYLAYVTSILRSPIDGGYVSLSQMRQMIEVQLSDLYEKDPTFVVTMRTRMAEVDSNLNATLKNEEKVQRKKFQRKISCYMDLLLDVRQYPQFKQYARYQQMRNDIDKVMEEPFYRQSNECYKEGITIALERADKMLKQINKNGKQGKEGGSEGT